MFLIRFFLAFSLVSLFFISNNAFAQMPMPSASPSPTPSPTPSPSPTPTGRPPDAFTSPSPSPAPVAVCGNWICETYAGEQCDDGNLANGDGCSSTCQIEPTSTASPSPSPMP